MLRRKCYSPCHAMSYTIGHMPYTIHHCSYTIDRTSDAMLTTPYVNTHHVIHYSPFTACYSSNAIHRTPYALCQAPYSIHNMLRTLCRTPDIICHHVLHIIRHMPYAMCHYHAPYTNGQRTPYGAISHAPYAFSRTPYTLCLLTFIRYAPSVSRCAPAKILPTGDYDYENIFSLLLHSACPAIYNNIFPSRRSKSNLREDLLMCFI